MKNIKERALFVIYGQTDRALIGFGSNPEPGIKLMNNEKFLRESITGNILVCDKETYLSLSPGIKISTKTKIVITDDLLWTTGNPAEDDTLKNVTTPWQALEKAENVPGGKICILGNEELNNFFIKNMLFDELHFTEVEIWLGRSPVFPRLPFSLNDNYKKTCHEVFKKCDIFDSHTFTIFSFKRIST